jgi:hypothetical protein
MTWLGAYSPLAWPRLPPRQALSPCRWPPPAPIWQANCEDGLPERLRCRCGTACAPGGVYSEVVVRYFGQAGIRKNERLGPHALRATAATSALENGDIARVQEWLGLAC